MASTIVFFSKFVDGIDVHVDFACNEALKTMAVKDLLERLGGACRL
jgi:hypothetical protein